MNLIDRVLNNFRVRRERILRGDVNSIPSPFKRFRNDFIGVEIGRNYMITSYTKVGKTQFSSFLFIYIPLLYAYQHPDKVRVKIFYYPLEETPEQVVCRFMSFLLHWMSKGKITISPMDLNSTRNIALDEEILELLESEEYRKILDFFEKSVVFSDSTNASGVWFECQRYAKENGKIYKNKVKFKDEFGVEKEGEKFDHYEPNDPDEYKIIYFDHLGMTTPERGMNLRETMVKLSEYFVLLRNRYKFSTVIIQQQAITDNLEAFKMQRLRPTIANLGDAKTVARDVDYCLGLFDPVRYEIPRYPANDNGYDITKFKNNIRFAEVLLNRHGEANGMVALMFIGQCNYWEELPPAKDANSMERIYRRLREIRNQPQQVRGNSFFTHTIKKLISKFNL